MTTHRHETPSDTQRTLQDSEERFRLLVDEITTVVWVTDPAGRFIEPQAEWEAYTGQSWEEHRDWGWANALHPEDSARVAEIWQEAVAEIKPYESSGRLWCTAAGDYHHFVARAVPRRNADGSVLEWIGTIIDVDSKKRAERALRDTEARFRLMVESVKDYAIFMLDRGGHVASWNAGAERIKGYRADEIIGEHFFSVLYRGGRREGQARKRAEGGCCGRMC